MTRLSERRTPSDDCSHAVPRHCRQQPSAPPVNRGAVFLLAANGRHFAEYPAVRPKRRTRYDRMAARSRERTTPSGTCEACQKPAIRLTRRMAVRHPSRRSKGARGNVRRPPALRIDGATRPLPTSPPPSVLCAACPARQGKAIMDVLPARAPVIKQIFDSPIGYRIFRKGRILPDLPWARATIGRWRTTTHTGITAGPDQRAERSEERRVGK